MSLNKSCPTKFLKGFKKPQISTWVINCLTKVIITYVGCPSFTAQCESEGSRPVRDQGESAGWAGQQITTHTSTWRTPRSSFYVEDESRFFRQLLPQQAWWAAQAAELKGNPALSKAVVCETVLLICWYSMSCKVKKPLDFLSDRVFTQKIRGFWLPDIPQTIPQSSKRSLLRATIPAW